MYKKPEHCKGCVFFRNAGRNNPPPHLKKYNAWCLAKGSSAKDAVGWCKQHGRKTIHE